MGASPGGPASGRAPRAWLCYQFGEDRALRFTADREAGAAA